MNKSIYDEALDILVDSFTDPQDEGNDCYMFNRKQMNKISKAIRKAQKQEKLLKLYQRLYQDYDDLTMEEEVDIIKQIKELENE